MAVLCTSCGGSGESSVNPTQRCSTCGGYGVLAGMTKTNGHIQYLTPPMMIDVKDLRDAYTYVRVGFNLDEQHHIYGKRTMMAPATPGTGNDEDTKKPIWDEHHVTRGFLVGVIAGLLAEKEESGPGRGAQLLNAVLEYEQGKVVIAPDGIFVLATGNEALQGARVKRFPTITSQQWKELVKK